MNSDCQHCNHPLRWVSVVAWATAFDVRDQHLCLALDCRCHDHHE